MTQAPKAELEMISLVAEIPSYLHGTNVSCIEAVTRRLAKILKLPLDLDSLRVASTRWELDVSKQIEQDEALATQIRKLEDGLRRPAAQGSSGRAVMTSYCNMHDLWLAHTKLEV